VKECRSRYFEEVDREKPGRKEGRKLTGQQDVGPLGNREMLASLLPTGGSILSEIKFGRKLLLSRKSKKKTIKTL
jgi:hypothetical protein